MNRVIASSLIILGAASSISLVARLMFPEILPVLDVMRIIFYLMVAVTVIAILRNIVGLITFGVFGPAIISLGLTRIGDIYWGLAAFFAVIGMGILVRLILEPLKLQMGHRMALVVITVASVLGFFIFAGLHTGNASLTVVEFLPILISAWIAERFVKERYENDWKASLQHLGFTLIAVLVTFLLLNEKLLMNYFIYTPELWILPVVLNILIGFKVRIRLLEFFRFRNLAKGNPKGGGYSGILTLNLRNREYIDKYNPAKCFRNTTKFGVKEALEKADVPVPRTLAKFQSFSDLKSLEGVLAKVSKQGFVVKPNNSYGGRGILVIKSGDGCGFEKISGERLTANDIMEHMEAALDGEFSGKWTPDALLMEELLVPNPEFAKLSYSGLADIRVIVFKGVPVMAMTRLPTKKSGGKANLHQGAVGAGIDLSTGRITSAVLAHHKIAITSHPDTGVELIGKQIPFWSEILYLAVKAQKEIGLGYVGVDVVIDKTRGPLVMEVNKRPGLEIQNANREPLLKKLQAVETLLASQTQTESSVEECLGAMRFIESRLEIKEKESTSFGGSDE